MLRGCTASCGICTTRRRRPCVTSIPSRRSIAIRPGSRAATLETGGPAPAPGARREENLTRLNGELVQLYGVIQGVDAAPTTQAVAAVRELERALAERLARWRELQGSFRSATRGVQYERP